MRSERGVELLHHGLCSKNFEPRATDSDYFGFWCKKCNIISEIKAVLIDNRGRIIFNIYCPNCKAFDALKTHPDFGSRERGSMLSKFHLSPKLGLRIGKHEWDDA